jgi:hypothetical protein
MEQVIDQDEQESHHEVNGRDSQLFQLTHSNNKQHSNQYSVSNLHSN